MPKVLLTAEQREQEVFNCRKRSLKGLIRQKMIEYGIERQTIANVLGISEHTLWYRLQSPAERLNVNELAVLAVTLKISNEELIRILRKGV